MFLRFITAMAWAWGGAWALVLLAGFFYNCITGWSTKKLWSAVHLTSLAVPAWAWLAARYLRWL